MADAISGLQVALIGAGGVAFGAVGKGVLDWFLAIGRVRADREARAEARRDKRAERRDDLQRQTLLDLQDAAMALARATDRGFQQDAFAAVGTDPVPWGKFEWPADLDEESRVAHARVRQLRSRVRNDELRDTIAIFSAACVGQGGAESQRLATEARARGLHALELLLDTAGQLVREMDDL